MNINELSWPDNINEISFSGLTFSELWFLTTSMKDGSLPSRLVEKPDKFGYKEAFLDIGDDRYAIKFRNQVCDSHLGGVYTDFKNRVFYVRKHKKPKQYTSIE